MRILIIDDEYETRAGITRLLGRLGQQYAVVGEAENGYEGMLLVKQLQPDVVITDIMMPRINGLDMIENAGKTSPKTQFIILSGYAEFELARRAVTLPVAEYLLKPITVEQMRAALQALEESKAGVAKQANGAPFPATADSYGEISSYIVNSIQKNYAQKLHLEEFARQLNLTPEYAGRVFSRETGKSFSVFLRDVRMENAQRLLRDTDLKIYEVAYKTGYSDVKYFCRVFKEYSGVSAKQYIRRQLADK